MSEMDKIFYTVLSGVLVYISGQVLLKLFLDPIVKLKETIGAVNCTAVKFAHIIHLTEAVRHEQFSEAFNELRSQSGEIYARYSAIPLYSIVRYLFGLPSKKCLFEAARNLIALSNWMSHESPNKVGFILKNMQDLYLNLNLQIPPEDAIDRDLIDKLVQSYIKGA